MLAAAENALPMEFLVGTGGVEKDSAAFVSGPISGGNREAATSKNYR